MLTFSEDPVVFKGETLLSRTIPSKTEDLTNISEDLYHILRTRLCLSEREIIMSRVCFEEAVNNAMIHGNLGVVKSKVEIYVGIDEDLLFFVVHDEGDGFNPEDLPEVSSDHLFRENGRGVFMMEHFMDQVTFYDHGATLYMAKKINLMG